MKTRKSLIFLFAASLCALASSAFAEADEGFYDKNDIRGFVSVGADYRGMRSAYANYLNRLLFNKNQGVIVETITATDTTKEAVLDKDISKYEHFNDYYLGLHIEIGAQYHQFLTWFDINFMPTQTSDKPANFSSSTGKRLYDVKWFAYGIDWMFGWKLFGENTFINLIPSAGIGLNLLNVHFASEYQFEEAENSGNYVQCRNRYYSTLSPTFTAQLELRFAIDPFSVGAYGGYRVVRFDEFDFEGYDLGDPDNNGDTWFLGAKITWTFLSENQKKLRDKL